MDIDTWTRLFFATAGVDDLVWNVHYGCLQHVHSMAPIQRAQGKDSPGTRIVFTNSDVQGFIVAQLEYWWNAAVRWKANKRNYSWYLGHILHAVQDSYPRGHTVRSSTPTSCGKIVLFQGYDAQHGNDAHKSGDFTPSSSKKESDPTLAKRYQCAIDTSTHVLQTFAACLRDVSKCGFAPVKAWLLTDIYALEAGAATRTAGGSRADFAKSGISAPNSGFVAEPNVSIGGTAHVTLYNPKSTQKWSTKTGVKLCQASREIVSKAPTHTLGVKHYVEKPFTSYVNPSAPATH